MLVCRSRLERGRARKGTRSSILLPSASPREHTGPVPLFEDLYQFLRWLRERGYVESAAKSEYLVELYLGDKGIPSAGPQDDTAPMRFPPPKK